MGSYYKKRKGERGPRPVTRAAWLYHETLPDLLPAIRAQGLRPLRDVASRLARDAAEKAAADADVEVDPGFVHLYASEAPLRLALLRREVALLRVRTGGLDAAFLTRDPRAALGEAMGRLHLPAGPLRDVRERLAARDAAGALDLLAPFVAAAPERAWEAPPFDGSYRYAGIIPATALQVLLELPPEIGAAVSLSQALATPHALEARRWAPLAAADLAAAARGLGRTEFPADP